MQQILCVYGFDEGFQLSVPTQGGTKDDLSSSQQIPDQRMNPGLGGITWYIFGGVGCSVDYQWPCRLAYHYLDWALTIG